MLCFNKWAKSNHSVMVVMMTEAAIKFQDYNHHHHHHDNHCHHTLQARPEIHRAVNMKFPVFCHLV
jgi:hypothetical protein